MAKLSTGNGGKPKGDSLLSKLNPVTASFDAGPASAQAGLPPAPSAFSEAADHADPPLAISASLDATATPLPPSLDVSDLDAKPSRSPSFLTRMGSGLKSLSKALTPKSGGGGGKSKSRSSASPSPMDALAGTAPSQLLPGASSHPSSSSLDLHLGSDQQQGLRSSPSYGQAHTADEERSWVADASREGSCEVQSAIKPSRAGLPPRSPAASPAPSSPVNEPLAAKLAACALLPAAAPAATATPAAASPAVASPAAATPAAREPATPAPAPALAAEGSSYEDAAMDTDAGPAAGREGAQASPVASLSASPTLPAVPSRDGLASEPSGDQAHEALETEPTEPGEVVRCGGDAALSFPALLASEPSESPSALHSAGVSPLRAEAVAVTVAAVGGEASPAAAAGQSGAAAGAPASPVAVASPGAHEMFSALKEVDAQGGAAGEALRGASLTAEALMAEEAVEMVDAACAGKDPAGGFEAAIAMACAVEGGSPERITAVAQAPVSAAEPCTAGELPSGADAADDEAMADVASAPEDGHVVAEGAVAWAAAADTAAEAVQGEPSYATAEGFMSVQGSLQAPLSPGAEPPAGLELPAGEMEAVAADGAQREELELERTAEALEAAAVVADEAEAAVADAVGEADAEVYAAAESVPMGLAAAELPEVMAGLSEPANEGAPAAEPVSCVCDDIDMEVS